MTENQNKNIALAFRNVAKEDPDFPAIVSPDSMISYGQLWSLSSYFAEKLQELGIGQRSLVVLNTHDMRFSIATLLGTSLLGAQMVIAGKQMAISQLFEPDLFLRTPDSAGTDIVNFVTIDQSWVPKSNDEPDWDAEKFPGYMVETDPWLHLNTSGSTGMAKFLTLSQRIAYDRTMAVSGDFPRRGVFMGTTFGCTTRPFYARMLGVLLNGGTIANGANLEFWKALGVNYVCGPAFQVLRMIGDTPINPKISRVEVSGAKLIPGEVGALLQSFRSVTDVYGASETNKTYARILSLNEQGMVDVIGAPTDTHIEIIDDDGHIVAPGEQGTIRIRNNYMVDGYLKDPKSTRTHFRDGWFYPDDIGRWNEDGILEVLGRNSDVVNIGGMKLNLQLVDLILSTVDGVDDAISCINPKPKAHTEIVAFVQISVGAEHGSVLSNLRDVAQKQLGVEFAPRQIHTIAKVPRGVDGTPLRSMCQNLVLTALMKNREQGFKK